MTAICFAGKFESKKDGVIWLSGLREPLLDSLVHGEVLALRLAFGREPGEMLVYLELMSRKRRYQTVVLRELKLEKETHFYFIPKKWIRPVKLYVTWGKSIRSDTGVVIDMKFRTRAEAKAFVRGTGYVSLSTQLMVGDRGYCVHRLEGGSYWFHGHFDSFSG